MITSKRSKRNLLCKIVLSICISAILVLNVGELSLDNINNTIFKLCGNFLYVSKNSEHALEDAENEVQMVLKEGGGCDGETFEEYFYTPKDLEQNKQNEQNEQMQNSVTKQVEKKDLPPLDPNTAKPIKITNLSAKSVNLETGAGFINNTTDFKLDNKALLDAKANVKFEKTDDPQILIVHTHTTESYGDGRDKYDAKTSFRTQDFERSVVAVGNEVAKTFEEQGFKTVHATEIHDYPKFTGGYSRSIKTVEKYMKKYPSIKMVIDVHRDSITTANGMKYRPVTEINGESVAQVMIFAGTDQTKLYHPNWRENLKFEMDVQKEMLTTFPKLARPIVLRENRYNTHTTNASFVLEVGSDANTLEEAKLGGKYAAQSIAKVIKEQYM